MKDWKNELGLIELRKTTQTDDLHHERLANDEYMMLSPEVAIERSRYQALPPWLRATAYAAAFGLSTDRAIVSGKAAARLWGISIMGFDPTVDLVYVEGHAPARSCWHKYTRYRSVNLTQSQVVSINGMRITTPERTAADVARWHGMYDGVVAFDSLRRLQPDISLRDLRAAALGTHVYRGRPLVREALSLCRPHIDSPLESYARMKIIEAGIGTLIETQKEISVQTGSAFYVDILIDGIIAVEVDGQIKYDGVTYGKPTDEVLRQERRREVLLQNSGLRVIRAGVNDLRDSGMGDCPLIENVRSALRQIHRSQAVS